jgi:dihydroorotate dehydrogenase
MTWKRTGFAGKTLTLEPRRGKKFDEEGNMPLRDDGLTPEELFPRSIWVDFKNGGRMINVVGLSNFGADFYLRTGRYHSINEPFFLSFMPVAKDPSGREAELRAFCQLLVRHLPFRAPVALQINFGCPNTGHDPSEFYAEIYTLIETAKSLLGIPIVANTNALMPTAILIETARIADALWIGNTIPFGDKGAGRYIDWSRFGEISPVRKRGLPADGGLSGPECLPLTLEKVRDLRNGGVTIPIVGGNGIRTTEDLKKLYQTNYNTIFVGSLNIVKP